MDELEQRIVALGAALERGEIELAMKELRGCDLERLVQSKNVTPRLRGMIDRALAAAAQARAARETELRALEAAGPLAGEAPIGHRVAQSADRPRVIALLGDLFDEVAPGEVAVESKKLLDEDIARALAADDVRIFLLERAGEVIALVRVDLQTGFPAFRLRADHRCGYIDQMFVRPAFRKQGLGKRLLELCEEWLRGQGVAYCLLHAAPLALGFYKTRGYQSTRELFKRL